MRRTSLMNTRRTPLGYRAESALCRQGIVNSCGSQLWIAPTQQAASPTTSGQSEPDKSAQITH
jgi:hypothetical protein